MKRLDNTIAVVTGAGRGIGRAIAMKMAEEGSNINVADIDESIASETVQLIEKDGGKAVQTHVDVTDSSSIKTMIEATAEKLGAPNILVNNAGIFFNASIVDMTREEWQRMIDVNLTSVFLVTQAMIRYWLSNNLKGTIVNLSSMVASMAFKNSSHYIASKGGVSAFTRATAYEYTDQGIRVNAVAPGMISTEITRPALNDPSTRDEWLGKIPMGRFGVPTDIANVVAFLASAESEYVVGQTIYIDGGWLLY